MPIAPIVFFVDPDFGVVDSSRRLMEQNQIPVQAYQNPLRFLNEAPRSPLGCLVTELRLPGMSGVELLGKMRADGWTIPTLIVTSAGDISVCSQAFRAGVTDFLEKPVPARALLARVREVLEARSIEYDYWLQRESVIQRVSGLTDRERQVLKGLVSGNSMKEIAGDFGTSFQSVARHRQRILSKLQVENDVALANLLREPP